MNSDIDASAGNQNNASNGSQVWLVAGLLGGLLAALLSVLVPDFSTERQLDVVARINDADISREKYLGHLQSLSSDKREAITPEDARYVLERIIEEELLVQRGLEVGLADNDKRTRAAIIDAMVNMTTANAESSSPSDAEVERFYDQHRAYFTPTARLRVRQLTLSDKTRASRAYERLERGDAFSEVDRELGLRTALSLPDTLLPLVKLREYLGPSAVQMLQSQSQGFVSMPMPQGKQFRILWLLEKQSGHTPRLADVRDQVESELVRRRGDQSLRAYLEWLKDRADIRYPSELPL